MPNVVKNTTIISLLDLISPHTCRGCGAIGAPLCDRCKNYLTANFFNLCPHCKAPTKSGLCATCHTTIPLFIAGERNDLLNTLIHDYKYHSNRSLARPLAAILDTALPHPQGQVVLIPLPTIHKHVRMRGLDHTLLLAKSLARLRGPHYHVERALLRANTTIQVGSTRTSRLAQAAKAYQINPHFTLDPANTYILIDDVWTTGASMQSATKTLQAAGATKIIQAVLAISL